MRPLSTRFTFLVTDPDGWTAELAFPVEEALAFIQAAAFDYVKEHWPSTPHPVFPPPRYFDNWFDAGDVKLVLARAGERFEELGLPISFGQRATKKRRAHAALGSEARTSGGLGDLAHRMGSDLEARRPRSAP